MVDILDTLDSVHSSDSSLITYIDTLPGFLELKYETSDVILSQLLSPDTGSDFERRVSVDTLNRDNSSTLLTNLLNEGYGLYIYQDAGEDIGFYAFQIKGDTMYIFRFQIFEKFQSQGKLRKMNKKMIAYIRQNNIVNYIQIGKGRAEAETGKVNKKAEIAISQLYEMQEELCIQVDRDMHTISL